jgi:hypothetical protein
MSLGEPIAAVSVGLLDALVPTGIVAVLAFVCALPVFDPTTAFLLALLPATIVFFGLTANGFACFRGERAVFPVTRRILLTLFSFLP